MTGPYSSPYSPVGRARFAGISRPYRKTIAATVAAPVSTTPINCLVISRPLTGQIDIFRSTLPKSALRFLKQNLYLIFEVIEELPPMQTGWMLRVVYSLIKGALDVLI